MKKIIKFPFYLIGFAVYPVLSLYVTNIEKLHFLSIFGYMLSFVAIALLIWKLLGTYIKDTEKAAIIVSMAVLLFFSYSLVPILISTLCQYLGGGIASFIRKHVDTMYGTLVLLPLLIIMGYFLLKWFFRFQKRHGTTPIMNLVCFALLFSVFAPVLPFGNRESSNSTSAKIGQIWMKKLEQDTQPLRANKDSLPDIYIIYLDGYARHDILKTLYDVDNSSFLLHLEEQGFYIANESHSNFGATYFSILTFLNFMHLDPFIEILPEGYNDFLPIFELTFSNRTFKSLREIGYQLVVFSNGYPLTDYRDADQYIRLPAQTNDFGQTLISNTPLANLFTFQYDYRRQNIIYGLERIPDVASNPKATLAFIHVLAPHPPFVFDKNGKSVNPPYKFNGNDANDFFVTGSREEYIKGYKGQVIFITNFVQKTIDEILVNSSQIPIIILQGDHGPGLTFNYDEYEEKSIQERYSILNAYLLPNGGNKFLYPTISPVNSMRIVFNTYFGTHYPLLADRSYYSSRESRYQLIDITNQLNR